MSVSESEAFDWGVSLPAEARRRLAPRLLESVDPDEASDAAAESWLRTEATAAYDALRADPSAAIPAEEVRARLEATWAASS
ncbi:addiction module protein [Nocardioides sp. 503]|uniref:addiction module protein n=1 Tax=Nocardioides sp. 503 TaxID=2508326 RepID=UPI00106FE124